MNKEADRRHQLIAATLREIGAKGTLNVTVGQIAKRAGVSPGLAFHYFGDKERLFLAAMRSILRDYGRQIRRALKGCETPRARLEAILHQNFADMQFEDGAIAAWLNFYVLAQTSPEAQRLLTLYHRRLHSNLVHDLRPLIGARADETAERLAGLVDGLYLRFALNRDAVDPAPAVALVMDALNRELAA
ncbi:HTH-type transcriptional regulator BetI [Roseivivax sp. THAF40]|uniref:choline-binding transcriptional repressor BetI n=1 Tax=unclassified Roseivivax TaxID=2639302 RepID=UPI001268A008|nr:MULTISPECIES: transcriptional regulator BetI [unclassified Roseivivax]QFS83410.1 HTH-type transcriptional regulator BetI [Roseivivax sp. THAF197b]QFT47154.1 HTH-type transcriptional regulator BetI [Roseivivax sp. THAF40]